MSETLMTEEAANTTEGQPDSQSAENQPSQDGQQSAQQQQASDGQTNANAEDGKGEGSTDGDQGKPQGAPEKYEFKAHEGQQFDTQVLEQFSEVAKELNLSQDAAQKVLDKMSPVLAARQAEAIEAVKTQWAEQARADKEFGGEKLDQNIAVAKKALDQFGSPELSKLLKESGLGNNPEVIRFMYRAGKAISEDKFVGNGAGGKPTPKSNNDYASSLYPTQQ